MTRNHPEEEELPHGLSPDDLDRLGMFMRREFRALRDEIGTRQQPKVNVNGGWKVAAIVLGLLSAFLSALFAWGLSKIDTQGQKLDAVVADVAVIKCQLSTDCHKPRLERGAVND